jgi:glycerol-3-phosphate dehydrogenase (NAD(P)+)
MVITEKKCAVIGYGSWATAIVKILSENSTPIYWHILNDEVAESIQTTKRNCKYLRDTELDTSNIEITSDINQAIGNAQYVILAMPSAFMKSVLQPLTTSLADKYIISAIKGIVPDDYTVVSEYLTKHYDANPSMTGIITGPTHAEEVAMSRLSYLTVAFPSMSIAEHIGTLFQRPYINVNYSEDVIATEYAAIVKNIYALSVGLATGLGYGDNFVSVLIANCAAEMKLFINNISPKNDRLCTSAFLGDLLVTCYSTYSRNRRLGLLIGPG